MRFALRLSVLAALALPFLVLAELVSDSGPVGSPRDPSSSGPPAAPATGPTPIDARVPDRIPPVTHGAGDAGPASAGTPSVETSSAEPAPAARPRSEPGALVRVSVVETGSGGPVAGVRVRMRQPETGIAREGRTDARGRVTLRGLPADAWGRARLAAELAGWLILRDPAGALFARTGPEEIRVTMVRTAGLCGAVTATDGRPVAGALVHLDLERSCCPHLESLASHRQEAEVLVRDGAWARTDGEGRFVLHDLPPGGRCVIGVRAPGCAPARRVFVLDPGESRRGISIRLSRGVEIRGVVVGSRGAPVARAEILMGRAGRLALTLAADADGGFRLGGVSPGRISLKARAPGCAHSMPLILTVRRGVPVGQVRLELRPEAPGVRGRVVTAAGKPRAGVEVAAHPVRRPGLLAGETFQPPRAETGPDGGFLLIGLQPGWTYRLEAAAPGQRLPVVHGPIASPAPPVTLILGALGALEVVAGPEVRAPITRVSVAPARRPDGGISDAFRAWPVRFEGLPAGVYGVVAWSRGEKVAAAKGVHVTAGPRPARVRLRAVPARAVGGRVTDAAGRALAGAPVTALIRDSMHQLSRRATTTDAEGRFRLRGLEGEHVDLVVGGDGRGYAVCERVPVGASNVAVVFAPSCRVRVAVRATEDGRPLPGAEVGMITAGFGAMRRRTDADGRTVFRVSPGTYALVVRAEGYQPTGCRIPVRPAGRDVTREFRLAREGLPDDAGGQTGR